MSRVSEERDRNPEWDPIYGNDDTGKTNDEVGDALSFGLMGLGSRRARSRAVEEMMDTELPEYSEEGYAYEGDYSPEALGRPEEAQHSLADDAGEGKAAQLAALQRMLQESDQAVGSQQSLDRYQAMQGASQMANSREGAIRQRSRAQGRMGGAADMMASQDAAQAGADRNLNAGMQSAQMAALQRLAGTQAYAGLGSQMRGQDQNLAFRNQDAINTFNLANTGARNAVNLANVNNRNEAAQLNRAGHQAVSNANVARRDQNVGNVAQAHAAKQAGIANAMGGFATGQQNQAAQQQSAGGELIKGFLKAYGAGSAGENVT